MPRHAHSTLPPKTRARIESLLLQTRLTQVTIVAKCGVSPSRVSVIAREVGFSPWTRKSNRRSRAQEERNRDIIRLVRLGLTYREIGEQYGVSRQRAQQIVRLYGGGLRLCK